MARKRLVGLASAKLEASTAKNAAPGKGPSLDVVSCAPPPYY